MDQLATKLMVKHARRQQRLGKGMFTSRLNDTTKAVRTLVANKLKLPLAIVAYATMCCMSCSQPTRPKAVAAAAKWVPSAKVGYWQICSIRENTEVACSVWNEKGTVLMDERYLPLDDGVPPIADQLIIGDRPCSGAYEVCLENGRILVPQFIFEREKARIQRH